MSRAGSLLCFVLMAIALPAFCQQGRFQWFISPGINLYLPIGTPHKGVYPVLWYDKDTDPGVLIGGFGVGMSVIKEHTEKISLKGQANVSKHTYWDEPFMVTSENGQPLTNFLAGSSDYTLGIAATAQYHLTNRLSAGIGAGAQIMLLSLSRLPDVAVASVGTPAKALARNQYYKPVMPVIPVEVSYKLGRTLLNIRYEHGLLNRLKGKLREYKKDRFGLLTLEAGFRLK